MDSRRSSLFDVLAARLHVRRPGRRRSSLGVFHLFTRVLKGLLFLCCGPVITAMHHEQDMRAMGGSERSSSTFDDDGRRAGAERRRYPVHVDRLCGVVSKDPIIEAVRLSSLRRDVRVLVRRHRCRIDRVRHSWRLMFMTFRRGEWSASLPARTTGNHCAIAATGIILHEFPLVMLVPPSARLGATFAGMADSIHRREPRRVLTPLFLGQENVFGAWRRRLARLSP